MKIKDSKDLKAAIISLEHESLTLETAIAGDFHNITESLRPSNILKKVIGGVKSDEDLQTTLMDSVIGLVAGFLTKKIVVGKSKNIFTNAIGNIIELIITSVVAKNSDSIKHLVSSLFKKILAAKKKTINEDAY